MAIYRNLKSLIDRNNSKFKARYFVTAAATSIIPSPSNPYSLHPFYSYPHAARCSHCFLSPLFKWIVPFQGPLFLSSPPWKLSQSATPLYLRGNCVVFKKVESSLNLNFRLHLLRSRVPPGQGVLDRIEEVKEDGLQSGFVESFANLPNFISLTRLVSGPVLGWMITNEMYSAAFVGLAISGATDWLDGYVARKMRINSVVGSYLDPLADKVLIGSVALAMVNMDLLHSGLVTLVVLRDVALVGGALYHRASSLSWKWSNWYDFFNFDGTRPEKIEPLYISKINTVLQLVLVAAALLQPEFGTQETQSYITYLSWLVASTTVASTAAYGAQYMGNRSALLTRKSKF